MEKNPDPSLKVALFYETFPGSTTVQCHLCPHHCRIAPGRTGICKVRENIAGTLYSMNYDRISSIALDPVEKKPLRHFHPGRTILSVGSAGCNLQCPFCQNHSISRCSMDQVETVFMTSSQLVAKALALKHQGNIGIAYTYNEPSVWYEFVLETSRLVKESGLLNVLVTNGYICQEPLEELLPLIDAMNIDLKSFNRDFYAKTLKGGLDEVKDTIRISAAKCHVEITTLVIPGENDSTQEMEEMADFLSSISPEIPLHLSRFFPCYGWADRQPTPVDTLKELAAVARKVLKNVYIGNV